MEMFALEAAGGKKTVDDSLSGTDFSYFTERM